MKEIIIGFILGLGKIVPGMSGSVLAISFNVYEKAIKSFNNLKNYKNLIYLSKLGIGIIISIAFFSKIILFFINKFELETIFLFIGLIFGSRYEIRKKIKSEYNYLSIITFFIVLVLNVLKISSHTVLYNDTLIYFISGIIESISSIIPGISGTAILLMIGTYNQVIYIFSNILNFNYIISNFSIILPFVIGMIAGLLLSIKLVNYMFSFYLQQMYSIILGFLYSSIVIMFISVKYNFYHFIPGIIFFVIGFISIKKVNHLF